MTRPERRATSLTPSFSSRFAPGLSVAVLLAVAPIPGNATTLMRIGAWPYGGPRGVEIDAARSLAFYGSGGAVVIADISDPGAPSIVSEAIRTDGVVQDLAYDETTHRLHVAAGTGGFEIWNVSVPADPAPLGGLDLSYFGADVPALGVALHETYAYVAAQYGLVHIIDVANPGQPVDIGFNGIGGSPSNDVFAAGGFLYVAGPNLVKLEIQPDGSLSSRLEDINTNVSLSTTVVVSGGYAWLTANGDVVVLNVTQTFLPIVGAYAFENARDVAVAGNVAYVADVTGGIRVLDATDPGQAVEIGSDPFGALDLRVVGTELFAVGSGRFRGFDVSTPSSPVPQGSLATPGTAYGVDVIGGFAYVADASGGLVALDVSDPADPSETGTADVNGLALDVSVDGDFAYVASQFEGLRVVDVSDPEAPAEVGSHVTPYYARGVFARADRAWVADLQAGLRIFDVSDPQSPSELGHADLPPFSGRVEVDGDYAYVANGGAGLSIVDVSDPGTAALVSSVPSGGSAFDLAFDSDRVYLADGSGGVSVVDVQNPLSPSVLGVWAPPGVLATHLAIRGNHVFAVDRDDLVALDVSVPQGPVELAREWIAGDGLGVFTAGNEIYVADGAAGLQVWQFSGATGVEESLVADGATRVTVEAGVARFDLPSGDLPLTIYDVGGRRVFAPARSEHVVFAPRVSGVYFWVVGETPVERGKVVVVR